MKIALFSHKHKEQDCTRVGVVMAEDQIVPVDAVMNSAKHKVPELEGVDATSINTILDTSGIALIRQAFDFAMNNGESTNILRSASVPIAECVFYPPLRTDLVDSAAHRLFFTNDLGAGRHLIDRNAGRCHIKPMNGRLQRRRMKATNQLTPKFRRITFPTPPSSCAVSQTDRSEIGMRLVESPCF